MFANIAPLAPAVAAACPLYARRYERMRRLYYAEVARSKAAEAPEARARWRREARATRDTLARILRRALRCYQLIKDEAHLFPGSLPGK